MSQPVQRALLFTDVVDSTRWVERLGDAGALERWSAHDSAARALLARHGGREIDRSDGFFLLFERADAAARFAQDYHAALCALDMQARAAIHVGTVTLRANAPADVARGAKAVEVEGLAKPMAARLMALAPGGRTLLSAAAAKALDGLAHHASHGHYRLKGLAEPAELFELLPSVGCPGAPPADTEKAYRVVRDGELWRPVREVRHNLPAERDAFVGRDTELRALADRIAGGARLVTLAGTGGTGKTRLARRYGRAWLGDWPGGVWFCDLSEARSAEGICFAVAAALGVPMTGDDSAQRLGHAIAARGRCLVILDNFEQVAAHAAATLGAWLDAAPDAAFVVTSRERLHLPGETVLTIEPLALAGDASALFEVRAQAQRPEFALDPGNRQAVAEVVRLLDGLPLAIELAAARIRVLSPAQIVERLRDRFVLLAGARGSAQRQATLRATIDWSWQLLAPWERTALAQCSVFEGGFTLAAAEAVLDLAAWPEAGPALDVVQALVDKSLLRTWVPADATRLDIAEPYFGMYLSIHEFAAERLDEAGEVGRRAAQTRHGEHYAAAGADEAIDALARRGGIARMHALGLELDNLAAAVRRAAERGDGGTAAACFRAACAVLRQRGRAGAQLSVELGRLAAATPGVPDRALPYLQAGLALALDRVQLTAEALQRLDEALLAARGTRNIAEQARVLDALAWLRHRAGDAEQARELQQQALALAISAGDRVLQGAALSNLGNMWFDLGQAGRAAECYLQAIEVHREVGDRRGEGVTLGNLAALHQDLGRLEDARPALEAALGIARESGNRLHEGITLANLGNLHQQQGRLDDALACNQAALATFREIGMRSYEAEARSQLARIRHMQGHSKAARELFDAALAIHRDLRDRRFEATTLADIGEMLLDLGDASASDEVLCEAETLLRTLDDRLQLGLVVAARGCVHARLDRRELARAALAEAQETADALQAQPASALGVRLSRLRHLVQGEARTD